MSVDDFYKVYGYCCFYKADTEKSDGVRIEEMTITLVCKGYPGKLMNHLQSERGYKIQEAGTGIYYVTGDKIPIQIVVTKALSSQENLWLKNLTNRLEKTEEAEKLIEDYRKNRGNTLYESVMDIIVRANRKKFEEARDMCEALEELMREKLEERVAEKLEERVAEKLEEKRNEWQRVGEEIGKEIGKGIGKEIGENRINELNKHLAKAGRMADIVKASEDGEYQRKLLEEYGL